MQQKKKKKRRRKSEIKKEREREGVEEEREEERRFLSHMKTGILWSAYYIILFYNFSHSYCFELQRTFLSRAEKEMNQKFI